MNEPGATGPQLGRRHRAVAQARDRALAAAALASGIATYLALTGAPPLRARRQLGADPAQSRSGAAARAGRLVAKRLVAVWAERRRGLAGSRLQVRLVGLFSLIAVLPTIIVAVFSYLFFSFGVESWFSDRVRTAIAEFARGRRRLCRRAPAGDPRRCAGDGHRPRPLRVQPADQPAIPGAGPDRPGGDARPDRGRRARPARAVLARTGLVFALGFEDVSKDALRRAQQGEVVDHDRRPDERVRALVRLDEFSDLYLYVGRFIETRVLGAPRADPPGGRAIRAARRAALRASRSPSR